jgi:hypothetical protein
MDSKEDIMIFMETTTTAQITQLLANRLQVLTSQYVHGKITQDQFQRMVSGALAESNVAFATSLRESAG